MEIKGRPTFYPAKTILLYFSNTFIDQIIFYQTNISHLIIYESGIFWLI